MKPRTTVKNDSSGTTASPGRGRPRNQKARTIVLQTARALLSDGGLGSVTIEALAARSGVSRPTIYRTWPNAHAVVMAALMDSPAAREKAADRQPSAIEALRLQLRAIVDVFSSKTGRSITHVLAAADPGTQLSKVFRNHFILARREEGRALISEAIRQGDIRASVTLETALDLLYAPIFYRILVGHAPLNDEFAESVLNELLQGLAPRSSAKARAVRR